MPPYFQEPFTPEEEALLGRFFTNTDRPVFALVNLPEVVKGALFARYSRSSKSLRRLFLDEFVTEAERGTEAIARSMSSGDDPVDHRRAADLYQRVFSDYGDDSVAQLGGAHLACEQASNVLTKVLEWGRLAAYLEQSTRYIYYDTPLGGRHRYHLPGEVESSGLAAEVEGWLDRLFVAYSEMAAHMRGVYEQRFPRTAGDSAMVWNATIRAKACDAVRGLLPAATLSNVGIYATGQAYEMALVRMQAHPLAEVRSYGEMMLEELRQVIPSFLVRVDRPDRGGAWSNYLAENQASLEGLGAELASDPSPAPGVTLTDWDPDAEEKLVAAALYAASEASDARLHQMAAALGPDDRRRVLDALFGERRNRRHRPGRALERTSYRFEVVCDFGAFRDLQRHRMMTIEWQRLTTRLGYDLPEDVESEGLAPRWRSLMDEAGSMYERLRRELGPDVAQYVVPFAAHIRFVMEMNARQALHLIELRSQPQGHPAYRQVVHAMHDLIADVAGHRLIAGAMSFVDRSGVELERLEAERTAELRRQRAGTG